VTDLTDMIGALPWRAGLSHANGGVVPRAGGGAESAHDDPPPKPVKNEINDWLVRAALAGTNEAGIVDGVCEQLSAAGLALARANVAMNLLDPTFDARIVRWTRAGGGVETAYALTLDSEANAGFRSSPFFYMIQNRHTYFRRRLDATYRRGEFPLLDELQDAGMTDFVALAQGVGESMLLGEGEGIVSSWITDAPAGFTEAQCELLQAIMPALTLAFMLRTTNRAARTLITTYLGRDAAERVLAGNIVRGRAEVIRATVWYSDLIGFTRISDTTSPDVVLELLNDYAQEQVEAIESQGGHVLKFIGDGMFAIFPDDDMARGCSRALAAASDLRRRIAAVNERREAAGLPVTDLHLALHVGELLYGNLGSPRRLDFTALGTAVNMAARMEAMCGSLEQNVIVSYAFAEAAGDARSALVSLGRYALKGIARPEELFTLDVGSTHAVEPVAS
jgi:adenylate cyclase